MAERKTREQHLKAIVEFKLSGGRHFLVTPTEGDSVRIDRQWPDPDRGRNVAGASALDGEGEVEPAWRFPQTWTLRERHYVRVTVTDAWKRHKQNRAEREAAEREAQTA